MPDLPPLQAVRVFEAVARHGNFTKAAAELNMTQSAVSYQVKLLESFVGAPLFNREARGVVLSERGMQVAPVAARALGDLAQGFRAARVETGTVLVISTMQTIASNWLAPRLGNFQLAHPEIAVRLDINDRLTDFAREDVDVAIRSGPGSWPGLEAEALLDQTFTPMAAPSYLAREGQPASPADLRRHVLIAPSDDWWLVWFKTAGVEVKGALTERPGVEVETQQMSARVALGGAGVGLLTPGFVADELASGRLVQIFDTLATSGSRYYVVYPEPNRRKRKVKLFRDWVLKEAGRG